MPSTVIKFFRYDETREELETTFQSGHRYRYTTVPPEVYQAMKSAFSKGDFFLQEIRDRFPYQREE